MPEGPSILIAKEELDQFAGKKILSASGSAQIDMRRLQHKKILRIATWGKHLLFCFDGFTVRIHFLMFGTYFIDSHKSLAPRLALTFARGRELNIYTSSVQLLEGDIHDHYDWSADIMSPKWDMRAAKKKLKEMPDTLIADALMDQDIFSGVGNIIKNEALYRAKVHPGSRTGSIPPRTLTALCREARGYAFEFLEQRKAGELSKHWQVYTKKKCGRDGAAIRKQYPGKLKRRTYFCEVCQQKYA